MRVSTAEWTEGRRRRPVYFVVGYAFFLVLVGSQLATPLYRVYQAEFGFSALTLTLIFAVYPLSVIIALFVFGPLSDVVGRWLPLAVAPVLTVAASLLFAVAGSTLALYVARVLQGLAVGAVSGAATAALAELEPRGDQRRAALAATLATAGGVAVGPLLTGLLVEYAGGQALPFVVYLVLLTPALAAPVLLRPRPGPRGSGGSWRPTRPSAPPALRAFAATTAAATVAWAVAGLFLAIVPSYLALLLGTGNLALLGGLVFVMLAISCAAQVAGRGLDAGRAQLAGLVGLIAGLAGVALAFPTRSLAVFLAGAALTGTGHGLTWIGATSALNRIAPDQRRADVTSTYFAVIYLGVALSAIGVGALADAVSLQWAVYIFAAAAAVAALAALPLVASADLPVAGPDG
jgi:MFS family permease